MAAEHELTFWGRDQFRNAQWSTIIPMLAGLLIEGALSFLQLGAVAAGWLMGGTLALLGLIVVSVCRRRTTFSTAGVTICAGFGRGRTHPWQDIRWVGVHRESNQHGDYALLRVTFANGRTRSLPGLGRSTLHPVPDFEANCRKVIRWWEASTDPSMRFHPQGKNWLYRKTPEELARILVPIAAFIIIAVVLLVRK
ncbi:hypothetical protein [Streptomyces sp. NBC_01198]|uniref:hypothetical protein n=1 Tax=Streptomyces sp. NBC_01198 TaxID=2903769 RepID=UPI002E14F516|nr:hypothetical protein OG702_05330 [Streptomyces sp. NBC_01198]